MYKITINANIDILIDNNIVLENLKKWLKTGAGIFEIENAEGVCFLNKENIITLKISKYSQQITKTVFNENFPIELETPNDNMTVINDNFDKEISDAICESIKEEE